MKWEQHGEIKENKKEAEKCEMQQHVSLFAAAFSGGARAQSKVLQFKKLLWSENL